MDSTIEVLWHGRGGQGAFTAARLLGQAVSADGDFHALAFPSFGPERRGAPVRAFTRLSLEPVGDRSAISKADYVIYLDETLLTLGWESELKENGCVLVNTAHEFTDRRLISIDAERISSEIMGRPQANTALLGALSVLCPEVTLPALINAIHTSLPKRHWQGNEAVLAEAARVMAQKLERPSETALDVEDFFTKAIEASSLTTPTPNQTISGSQDEFTLQPTPSDPHDFAQSTCYSAPLIVKDNAGWRRERPQIDARLCTGCESCYSYCPDGALVMDQRPVGLGPNEKAKRRPFPHLDEHFCKGCGICARICPTDAIVMIPEQKAQEATDTATEALS